MILAIANQKGGSGKTATAAAIAQAAAYRGDSVLAIDLDPQGNLSFCLGAGTGPGAYEMMTGTPARRLIIEQEGIHIIRSSRNLSTITEASTGAARRLQEALKGIKERYQIIVIDTPPTAGILQYNALQAADELLIPLQADTFGLQGLYQLSDIAKIIQRSNPNLKMAGILLTRHNERSTLSRQLAAAIREAGEKLQIPYLGAIREGIAIREAQALRQNMYTYAPKAKAVQEYMQLYERILELEEQ